MAGCDATYEDISNTLGFVTRTGEVCTVNGELIVHGIRKDLGLKVAKDR